MRIWDDNIKMDIKNIDSSLGLILHYNTGKSGILGKENGVNILYKINIFKTFVIESEDGFRSIGFPWVFNSNFF